MHPIERGFVVPVWVRARLGWPEGWHAAWLHGDKERWLSSENLSDKHVYRDGDAGIPDEFRPRDPNRADFGDRPDLLEN